MTVKLIPAMILCAAALTASADVRRWVGGASGAWREPSNWEPAGSVGESDTAVFDTEGEVSVFLDPSDSPYNSLDGLRVERGSVYLYTTGDCTHYKSFIRLHSAPEGAVRTNDFYVAGGASLCMSNAVIANKELRSTLRKTGDGLLEIRGANWGNDWGKFAEVILAGGTTTVLKDYKTYDYYFFSSPVRVCTGATLKSDINYLFANCGITVEEGGFFDASGASLYLDGIAGAGVLTNIGSVANIKLKNGPYVFSGKVYPTGSTATFTFGADGYTADDPGTWWQILGAGDSFSRVKAVFPNVARAPLGFAPGVGSFSIGGIQGENTSTLTLEDTDGQPVEVVSDWTNPAKMRLAGSGAFMNVANQRAASGATVDLSGLTGTLGALSSTLTIGDGTEAGWPALNPAMTFFSTNKDACVSIKAPSSGTVLTNDFCGNVMYCFYGTAGLLSFNPRGSWMQVRADGDLTVAGGHAEIGYYGLDMYNNTELTVTDGAYLGGVAGAYPFDFAGNLLPRELGAVLRLGSGSHEAVALVADGGTMAFSQIQCASLTVKNGGALDLYGAPVDLTSDWLFDGGVFRACVAAAGYHFYATPESDKIVLRVGPRGMTFDCRLHDNVYIYGHRQIYLRRPIYGTDGGDGGVRRTGGGLLFNYFPHEIAGRFENADGTIAILDRADITGAEKPLFGAGDFKLSNSRLEFHENFKTPFTARIGTGGRFLYDGAATFVTRKSATAPAQTLALGALEQEGFGALFFRDQAGGAATEVKITLASAPDLTDDGRVDQPVFIDFGGRIGFAAYGADTGLVPFTNYTAGVDGETAGKTVFWDGTRELHLASDRSVGALRLAGGNCAAYQDGVSPLWLDEGVRLTVGTGETPACVLLENTGANIAAIRGPGTLDFGPREGIVVAGDRGGSRYAVLGTTVDGSGGLTIVRSAVLDEKAGLAIGGDNVYAGGTRVYGTRVEPLVPGAFSSGELLIGNGELQGGTLYMNVEGLTIPNAVRAAGWGSRSDDSSAAVEFAKNGTLTGPFTAYDEVRLAAAAGVRGTFAGVVSGAKIWIWKGAGEIVFSAVNTFTNGVEIVGSTLVLAGNGTVGTGDILLNGGTLVVESDDAKTVPNRVCGTGTIRLAGRGAVTFAELAFASLQATETPGFTLDLASKVCEIASLEGVAAITTPRTGQTALIVADGGAAAFAGAVPANVTLYGPDEYRPSGMAVIVR